MSIEVVCKRTGHWKVHPPLTALPISDLVGFPSDADEPSPTPVQIQIFELLTHLTLIQLMQDLYISSDPPDG